MMGVKISKKGSTIYIITDTEIQKSIDDYYLKIEEETI